MTTIEHEQWGRVEGVEQVPCDFKKKKWMKNGASYEEVHGWREVREEKWKNVTDEYRLEDGRLKRVDSPGIGVEPGDRLAIVQRHHLTDGWCKQWNSSPIIDIDNFLNQYLENVIIVQRREE